MDIPDGVRAKGMRQLSGVYTQHSNRRRGRVGHLFQGRYKAMLVDKEAYLLDAQAMAQWQHGGGFSIDEPSAHRPDRSKRERLPVLYGSKA